MVFLLLEDATQITENSAFIKVLAQTISGPANAVYTFFWGTVDGGQTEANWQHSLAVGHKVDGEFGATITGLSDHEVYYFSCKAVQDIGFPATETSWPNASATLFTLSYPHKVCGSTVTPMRTPVAALSSRWAESLCPPSIKEHFRGGITQMYGATQSRIQVTTHTTTIGHYTVPVIAWNSTNPVIRGYVPPVVNAAQIIGDTGVKIGLTPAAFDFAPPVDGEFWAIKKGAWKLHMNVFVNGSFYNKAPGSPGSFRGGPYKLQVQVFPYSVYKRPIRGLPPVNYTFSIPNSGFIVEQKFILRTDCFWFCNLSLEVWAGQAGVQNRVTDVDVATIDMSATRNPL